MRFIIFVLLVLELTFAPSIAQESPGGAGTAEVIEVEVGETVAFLATAESSTPATFQWQKEGIDLPGATGNRLRLERLSVLQAGLYSVVASNSAGSTRSGFVRIAIRGMAPIATLPVITREPSDLTAPLYSNVAFNVVALATPAPTYQWLRNGTPIAGATSSSLSLTSITTGDAYSVVVTNDAGSTVSRTAILGIMSPAPVPAQTGIAPTITRQPGDITVPWQGNVGLLVLATGTPAPVYQWFKNDELLPGATNNMLTLTSVTESARYAARVSNSAGKLMSRTAYVTVAGAIAESVATVPVFSLQPVDRYATTQGSVTFTSVASGAPSPSYQWRKDGVPISGATSATFTLSSVSLSDAGMYSVLASNAAGAVLSNNVTLSVGAVPIILSQPAAQSATTGEAVVFSVSASGSPAPSFQWRKNGSNLYGATDATFRINSVSKTDEGSYSVVAMNSAGFTSSSSAFLSVQTPYLPSGPLAGVELRANYSLYVDVNGKRNVGFLIRGDTPKQILVRAVGPSLAALGVSGAMSDPQIDLFSGMNLIARNDNWGGDSDLMTAFSQCGATPFTSVDSKDAAILMTVAPGAYSALVSGVNGLGGMVVIEVYEMP